MKDDMIMNTPSGTLKSRVFRPWDLYRVTGSPSAWHRPSWSSPCNCKLDLDKAFIYALPPQASTTTEQFSFMYAYVICLPLPGLYQQATLLCLWASLRAVIWRLWAKVTSAGLQPAGPSVFDCNRCGLLVNPNAFEKNWGRPGVDRR